MNEVPPYTYDLLVWAQANNQTVLNVQALINKLDIDTKKRLLKARYDRELKDLEG